MFDDATDTMVDDSPAISARAEVERALVGGLLNRPDCIMAVAAVVQSAHIGDIQARTVYSCLRDMFALGKHVDLILVVNELKSRREFDALGGYGFIDEIAEHRPDTASVLAYAEEVRKAAIGNECLGAIAQAYGDLVQDGTNFGPVCADLMARLKQIERGDLHKREALTSAEIIRECLAPGAQAALVSTGYESLDGVHGGGLAMPSLTVIGAAPSVGKTQLANNLAVRMRKDDQPARVLYLSLEMGKAEMACRFISMLGGIDLGAAKAIQYRRAGEHTERMFGDAFDRGTQGFASRPIVMFNGSLDADGVRELAERYAERCDVLILDYLQRIGGTKNQKALERVEAASRTCKDIAVQHDIAVVALASLSREGYRDKTAKPDLVHLRECGNIEFDADNVWMLWRDKDDPATRDVLELHVRKQRNGPLDTLNFDFDLRTGRIAEVANGGTNDDF